MRCDPDQVLITEGIHQAIDLVVRMLGSPGDQAWVEEPSYWGIRGVLQSRYLTGISLYVLLLTVFATFIYFTRLQMVAALGEDTDLRATVLAQIDLITQIATLLVQLVITGHLMKRFGVAVALALLPVVVGLGFVGLAVAGSFAALVVFDACFRGIQRGITRPARETLFTVVSREDKYKSKAVTDTFVYRGGDLLGAWTEGALGGLGLGLMGLVTVAAPLALVWGGLGLWLGRSQESMRSSHAASERTEAPAPTLVSPAS